jgi:hypothetical protein
MIYATSNELCQNTHCVSEYIIPRDISSLKIQFLKKKKKKLYQISVTQWQKPKQ